MDRPTCKTCAYWEPDTGCGDPIEGCCHRAPPREQADADTRYAWFPPTLGRFWCGEHHDFPAYLVSLKGQPKAENCSVESVQEASINWIGLDGKRIRKALSENGIKTVGQLLSLTEDEILDMRNVGVWSLEEVREKLAKRGLKLRID